MIEYLKNEQIANFIKNSPDYQKSAETLLRLPTEVELQDDLTTYVKTDNGLRIEGVAKITTEVVIARNYGVIGKDSIGMPIYNEWVTPKETAIKNYGKSVIDNLSHTDFSSHKKVATIKAIEVTPEILNILGVKGDTLEIKVSWSETPMFAKIGDYITDGGYTISKHDFFTTYEQVRPTLKNKM